MTAPPQERCIHDRVCRSSKEHCDCRDLTCLEYRSRPLPAPAATTQNSRCGHYDVCYLIGMQSGCIADELHEVCQFDTRSRPLPSPTADAALDGIIKKMISDRTFCEEKEVNLSGASATYYGSRVACLEFYIDFITELRSKQAQQGGSTK